MVDIFYHLNKNIIYIIIQFDIYMTKSNKKITDQDAINMERLRSLGYKNTEIATMMGIHPNTVSKKINQVRRAKRATEEYLSHSATDDIDQDVPIVDSPPIPPSHSQPHCGNPGAMKETQSVAIPSQRGQHTTLSVLSNNPFDALSDFNEIANYVSAGGSVVGSGVSLLYDGFANEELPYEERMQRAMKGGMVVAGSILSAFATFQSLSETLQKNDSQRQRVGTHHEGK
jgi:hypothetical protein